MASNTPRHHDPELSRSPLGSAMILLGIYIVMYLAVAEVVHILSPANAAAPIARDERATTASAPMALPPEDLGAGHARTD